MTVTLGGKNPNRSKIINTCVALVQPMSLPMSLTMSLRYGTVHVPPDGIVPYYETKFRSDIGALKAPHGKQPQAPLVALPCSSASLSLYLGLVAIIDMGRHFFFHGIAYM